MASLHFILALALLWTSPGVRGAVNICGQDFGVESGIIPDASFSASSSATGRAPHHARLNGNSAWCAGTGTGNQYLQIDLGLPVNVWGIKTQGDPTNTQNYVTSYFVQYSFNGVDFAHVKTFSQLSSITKIFTGNTNNNGTTTVDLTTEYFSARYIRIIPFQFSVAGCFRVEIQGCAQYCPFALGIEGGSGPVLTASTSAVGSLPTSAKLGQTTSAWCAGSNNSGQYLLVYLQKTMTVTGIAIQGSPTAPNWIKAFRVHFGVTSASSRLHNNGSTLFNGNVDQSSVVINWFSSPITARFVKIEVQDFNNQICARIELIGCSNADCVLPLGLESNVITDSQMTASSHYHINYRADRGRLNKLSKWCSLESDAVTSSYLQIDLGFVATVTGIMTQGDYQLAQNYVQTYKLSYDFDQSANKLRCVRNEGNNDCKQFTGNINGNGAVLNMFPDQAFTARVVRIRPQSRYGTQSCLRVELYGCKQGFGASKGLQLGSQIATGVSVDSSIGAVNPPTFQLNGGTAWCSGAATGYLEVMFGRETMVAGVAIQGSPTTDSWVTKYRLSTRATIDGAFASVENDTEYRGSFNRDSAVVNWLASPLPTTAIRITVVASHTDACLRIEMYGLNSGCANPLLQTDDSQFTASSIYSDINSPPKGRLNSHPDAWVACFTNPDCPGGIDTTPHGWLQVCFNDFRTVSGIIIQRQGDQWGGAMRKFTIRYSYDGTTMNDYKQNGTVQEFIGNLNRYEAVTRLFPKPVAAKCIRVVATERNQNNGDTSARIRLLGCDLVPMVSVEDTVISLTKTSPVKTVDCVIVAHDQATFHWKRGQLEVVNDTVDTITVTAPTVVTDVENQWTLTLQVNPANVIQQYESCVIADAAQGLATCSSVYTCFASYPGAIAVTKTATVNVTELSANIGQPSNIISDSITATSAEITWGAPVQAGDFPITGYSYVLSPGGRNGSAYLSVSLENLSPYTDYNVNVKARNKLQDGITAPIQFKTLQAAPPAVTNFRNTSFVALFVNLAWDAPSPPNGLLSSYEIQFRKNSSSDSSSESIGVVTTYRLYLPTPDTIYIISIRALTGENAFTGPAKEIDVRTNEKQPDPPTALLITSSTPTTVLLSWLAPSVTNGDLISYKVRYEGSKTYFPSFRDQNSTFVPPSVLNSTVSGLFPGTEYRFTVSASTRAGFGNRSNEVTTNLDVAAPFKPLVTVMALPAGAEEELNITSIGVDGFTGQITGYEIILPTGNSSCSEITSAALAPATQFTSFTPEQIPYNAVVLKGIETVPGLDFVIPTPGNTSMCFRALVQSGKTIHYGAVESVQVERQYIKKPNSTSVGASPTLSSFIIELAQGLPTTSFYQVVVIELLQGQVAPLFFPSYYQNNGLFKFNATSHKAGTAYITGEFTEASFKERKRFTVGDGKTYPLNNRRRRSTSSGEQFINVALSPGSRYAVFQVAVSGSGSWQVSPWSSIVATTVPTVSVADTIISVTKSSPVKNVDCVLVAQAKATFQWRRGTSVVVNDTVHTVTVTAPTVVTDVDNQWTLTLQVNPANVGEQYESCVLSDAGQGLATCLSAYSCVASYSDAIAVNKTISVSVAELSAKIGQPSNITSDSITATSAVITWDAPVQAGDFPITGYIYGLSPGGRNGSANLSVSLSNLSPYTDYTVSVSASNKLQDGITGSFQFQTSQAAPPAVTNFRNTSFAASFVNLAWDDPSPPNGLLSSYEIQFRNNSASNSSSISIGVVATYRLDLPAAETIYIISIRALTGENAFTGPAVEITVITNEKPPDPPTALSIMSSAPTNVSLSWLAPSVTNGDLISYKVSYEGSKTYFQSFRDQNSTFVPSSVLNATVSGLFPGTEYRFTVSASTRAGFGNRSNEVTANLGVTAPLEPSVTVVTFPDGAEEELNITLIGVDGFTGEITGYEVILSTGNSSCSEVISADLVQTTQFTSFIPQQIPYDGVVVKGIETVAGLDFVIPTPGNTSMCFRAFVESEKTIYYGAVESFQVERQSIKKPNSTTVGASPTASSFIIELAQGLPTTSFYQVVVIELLPGQVAPPYVPSYYQNNGLFKFDATSHTAGTAYITGEFTANSFEDMKIFTVGDGNTYPLNNRRRRSTSSGEQFINVALSPGSHYAAFQIAVSNSGSWQVSPWSSVVATAPAEIPHDPSSNVGAIVAGIIAVLAVFIAVIVLIIFLRRRKAAKKDQCPVGNDNIALETKSLDTIDGEIISNVEAEPNGVKTDESGFNESRALPLSQRQPPSTVETDDRHPVIPVNAFSKFNETMRRDGNHSFTEEYKELNTGKLYTWDTATLQKNKPKNRYANIVPYDHSMVTKSASGSKKKLYINASYIDGYCKPKVYIAAQGPMPNTVDDFWELVWTEQVPAIIMATHVMERGKRKCEEYWPSKNPKTYRDITVVPIKEECYVEYTIRRFTLQKAGESREVYQFHFFGWPDFGVPEFPTDVLNFHRRFRAVFPYDYTSRPIVIHCSAGVGRTGTFIGIDAMIELAKTKQIVDVYNFVNFMRSRRISMVQTEDQYIFIYSALLESFTCGFTEMPTHELVTKLKSLASDDAQAEKSGYQKQFERLQFLTPHVKPSYYSMAATKQNMARNRFEDILPRDDCRVILQKPLHEDDNTDYINAVHTNGYKKRDAFIATQHPLDTTINDFWFMVLQKEASTIVMLNKVKEEGDLYPVFWPSDGMTVEYGKVVVKCTSLKGMASTTQLMLNVSGTQASKSKSKACAMLQYQDWPDHGVPADKTAILVLLLQIEKSQQMHGNGPIIVICSDGAGRSGSLIAVSVALERVKVEQLVDIFQTVKKIRLARPQYVENKEQFKFCHDIILTYLESFETYSNFRD